MEPPPPQPPQRAKDMVLGHGSGLGKWRVFLMCCTNIFWLHSSGVEPPQALFVTLSHMDTALLAMVRVRVAPMQKVQYRPCKEINQIGGAGRGWDLIKGKRRCIWNLCREEEGWGGAEVLNDA